MNKSDVSVWKNYAPTILLLVILLIAFLVFLPTGKLTANNLPALNIANGILLVLIGLLAGLLGGLIGSGGCSVERDSCRRPNRRCDNQALQAHDFETDFRIVLLVCVRKIHYSIFWT